MNKLNKKSHSQVKRHYMANRLTKRNKNFIRDRIKKDSSKSNKMYLCKKIGQSSCNLVIGNSVGLSGVGLYGILTQSGSIDIHVALFVIGQLVSLIASGIHVYFDVAYKDSG